MRKNNKYVWYACYGSNISKRRFMRYINKCEDQTEPVESRPYEFNHNIFFAKSSSIWENGAVAFLDADHKGRAYGRIYKITLEQFIEVQAMEGEKYQRKLEFDAVDDLPVYSFTDIEPKGVTGIPSKAYFDEILLGLNECYKGIYTPEEMEDYLNQVIKKDSE